MIYKDADNFNYGALIVTVLILITAITAIFGSFFTVDAGQKAIVLRFGAIQNEVSEGLHFKIPIIDSVKYFEARIIKYTTDAVVYSKDAQVITMSMSINYRIGLSASEIYKNLGPDYANKVIAPAVQDSVKAILALYDAQTILDNYGVVSRDIKEMLIGKLEKHGISVIEVNIVNHDYSDVFEAAVEAKQKAFVESQKAQNDLLRIKVEAEQKVTAANASAQQKVLEGQAQAEYSLSLAKAEAAGKLLRAQSEAEALRLQKEQITPQLLELRAIEVQKEYASRWNGALPSTVLGNQAQLLQLPSSILEQK